MVLWLVGREEEVSVRGGTGGWRPDDPQPGLTTDETKALHDDINYHEDAEDGTPEFPKSFVKFRVGFQLQRFVITVQVNIRLSIFIGQN